MKISIFRTLLLFVVCQNIILGSNQGFMKLINGSIFMKSEGNQKWIQIKADISIRPGDLFKTSSDFRGSLYISKNKINLKSGELFKFHRNGLHQKKGEHWYLVSSNTQDTPKEQLKTPRAKFRGRLLPEDHALLTRPGQFKRRKMLTEFNLFHGDMVELPERGRAEVIFTDESRLNIDAGSSLEFGVEGIFLNSGSVFCTISKRLSRFEVTTPNFLVAVRGTAFEVSHVEESRVRVFEGVVKVDNRGLRSRPIFLRRGQQASSNGRSNAVFSSDFKEINRPEYSKIIFADKNLKSQHYSSGQKLSELQSLQKIQGELRKSKVTGFKEFLSSDFNDPNLRVNTATKNSLVSDTEKPSLQDYLGRVANPGEDADFEIFQGGKATQGVGKVVESWKDDYRREVQSSTFLQRQKLDGLAPDFKNRRELVEERDKKISVDLRTRVQKEDFSRRAFGGGVREIEDQSITNREIINLRKFRNTQNLELKRIQQEQLRLVREKDLIDRKIKSNAKKLENNTSQGSSLQLEKTTLVFEKTRIDTVQKNLNSRENNIRNVIKKIDARIQDVLTGFAGRFRRDDQFNKDSRRLLLGR